MNYLSIDIGTTACKCQLFSGNGEILAYQFEEYPFLEQNGAQYVNVKAIESRLFRMIRSVSAAWEISSVAISSLGESFVLLDGEDNILFHPMLYTDPRGEAEAGEILSRFGAEKIFFVTGTVPHSMYSISKLLWIKNNEPALFEKAEKVMLMCDYFGYLLTGKRKIDSSLAARTGAFDIENMKFSEPLLSALGLSPLLFSEPARAGEVVGEIRRDLIPSGAVLVLGTHDQVAAALGAGALSAGDCVDGMGTVECMTALFEKKPSRIEMGRQGYPIVPYATEGLYCTYMLNYSCGSTVNWLRKGIMHGYKGQEKDFFSYMEKNMPSEPTGLIALPYFGGAATPYADLSAKGAILGLSTDTSDGALYRALLEGTAMEMRLNAEVCKDYGIAPRAAVATGGGANSEAWLRIKADIQRIPYKTLRSSEGGLCGLAMLQAVALSEASDLFAAREIFVRYQKSFAPSEADIYGEIYEKYKKVYQTIKEIF